MAICYNAAMSQLNENPIIWKRDPISGYGKFILALGLTVGFAFLSAIGLLEEWGEWFLALCVLALFTLTYTVKYWYGAKQRVLLYSDRMVIESFWPFSTKVFSFSNITGVNVSRRPSGSGLNPQTSTYLEVHYSYGGRDSIDVHNPHGLRRLLTDSLNRYHAARPP